MLFQVWLYLFKTDTSLQHYIIAENNLLFIKFNSITRVQILRYVRTHQINL